MHEAPQEFHQSSIEKNLIITSSRNHDDEHRQHQESRMKKRENLRRLKAKGERVEKYPFRNLYKGNGLT